MNNGYLIPCDVIHTIRLYDRDARLCSPTPIDLSAMDRHCRHVGDGVWELKINHGPGYRVYYAQAGKSLVLLLLGGDKRTQQADIDKAIDCWQDYQER